MSPCLGEDSGGIVTVIAMEDGEVVLAGGGVLDDRSGWRHCGAAAPDGTQRGFLGGIHSRRASVGEIDGTQDTWPRREDTWPTGRRRGGFLMFERDALVPPDAPRAPPPASAPGQPPRCPGDRDVPCFILSPAIEISVELIVRAILAMLSERVIDLCSERPSPP